MADAVTAFLAEQPGEPMAICRARGRCAQNPDGERRSPCADCVRLHAGETLEHAVERLERGAA